MAEPKDRTVYWMRWPTILIAGPLCVASLLYDRAFGIADQPLGFVLLLAITAYFLISSIVRRRAFVVRKGQLTQLARLPGKVVEVREIVAIEAYVTGIGIYTRAGETYDFNTAQTFLCQFAPPFALAAVAREAGADLILNYQQWPSRRLSRIRREIQNQT